MKTKLFTLLVVLVASMGTVFAWDYERVQIGDLYYNIDKYERIAEVVACANCSYGVAIPENIEYRTIKYSVTSIGGWAFSECNKMTSVYIPNSVTNIGARAFEGCTGLTSIEIPKSVTNIEDFAFKGCNNITKVIWNAKACSDFRSDLTPFYCYDSSATHVGNDLSFDIRSSIASFIFGNQVERIPAYLCKGMTELREITIPNSVTSIGRSAFEGCTGLPILDNIRYADTYLVETTDKSLSAYTIKEGTRYIGNDAFRNCKVLTSITIPSSVTSIGEYAFYGCDDLRSVRIYDLSAWCKISFLNINSNPFSYANNLYINDNLLTDLIIPDDVTSIKDYAFYGCNSITSLTIHNSVTGIGAYAFAYCNGLTSIDIPHNVTSIGDKAFSGCANLTSIYAPCGELERFQQLLNNDSRVKYKPLPYKVQIKSAANGSVTYPKNSCDELVLNAIPDYGYHFVQWSDGNTDNPRAFELTQDTTFEASFAISNFTIDLQKNYDEMGEVTGGGSYEYLSKRTISATANYGYHFVQWKGVGQQIPQNTISASEAYAIASELSDQETTSTKYNIIGYVTGTYASYSNSYYLSDDPNVPGNFIAFKCTSSANIGDYVLVSGYLKNYRGNTPETASGATLTKVDSPYANPYSFTLTRDTTIIAEFAKNIYTLTVQSADTTMGAVSNGGEFEYLAKYYLKATPNYGYHFVQWSDGNTDNPRYIQITQDTTFIAIFGKNPVIHYIYDYRKGSIEGDTTLASQASGDITFRAVPYPGYNFAQWADGNKDNPRTIFLDRDTTMEAIFEIALEGRCGKDLALTWTLDTTTLALSIEGEGELTENYTYGSYIRSVSIGKNVSDIGLEAFEHCFGITHVTLNSAAVVGKNYYYYYSSYTGYVYNTLTSIFGSGVEEYTFGGQIERIGSYAFYGSNKLTKVVIPEGCKYIGEYAFDNCGNIITIVCPSTVEYIGKSAFDSESIMNVYDYATTPQDMSVTNPYSGYALTLLRGVLATARLYVPEQSIELYREAYFWCYFGNILPIQATSVDVNDIRVTTTESTVTVLWPQINGAATYELVIRDKSGNSICTLVFNANGQLTQMVFNAPSRERAPQQTQTAGFSFTVTGLESNTGYNLTMTAKNSNGATLQTKTISFVTNGLQTLDNISDTPTKATKLLHNDQILILRGDKIYTITGQEVK